MRSRSGMTVTDPRYPVLPGAGDSRIKFRKQIPPIGARIAESDEEGIFQRRRGVVVQRLELQICQPAAGFFDETLTGRSIPLAGRPESRVQIGKSVRDQAGF